MIKSFKIFENYENKEIILNRLSEQFDSEFIDEYYEEHFKMDAEEIVSLWPNIIWQHIDDDEYIYIKFN